MIPSYIIIHHSETKDGQAKDWESIRRFHIESNGWSDVGYHYGVERVRGSITTFPGRPENREGAHCRAAGMNAKSLGICVVGNYDLIPPDDDLVTALVRLVVPLMKVYNIHASRVLGHRETYALDKKWSDYMKTCPGLLFDLDAFRALLAKEIP